MSCLITLWLLFFHLHVTSIFQWMEIPCKTLASQVLILKISCGLCNVLICLTNCEAIARSLAQTVWNVFPSESPRKWHWTVLQSWQARFLGKPTPSLNVRRIFELRANENCHWTCLLHIPTQVNHSAPMQVSRINFWVIAQAPSAATLKSTLLASMGGPHFWLRRGRLQRQVLRLKEISLFLLHARLPLRRVMLRLDLAVECFFKKCARALACKYGNEGKIHVWG